MIDILPGTIVLIFIVSFVFFIYDFITRYFIQQDSSAPVTEAESGSTSIEELTAAKGTTPIEELVATGENLAEEAVVNEPPQTETPTVSPWIAPVVSQTEELSPIVGESESSAPEAPAESAISDSPEATPEAETSSETDPPTPEVSPEAKGSTPIEELAQRTDSTEDATVNRPLTSETPTVSSGETLDPMVGDSESSSQAEPPSDSSTPEDAASVEAQPPAAEETPSETVAEDTPAESESEPTLPAATVAPPEVEETPSEIIAEETPTESEPETAQTAQEDTASPAATVAPPEVEETPIEELVAKTDFAEEATVDRSPTSETPTVSSGMTPLVSPEGTLDPMVGDSESPAPENPPSEVSTPEDATSVEAQPPAAEETPAESESEPEPTPPAATVAPPEIEETPPETVAEEEDAPEPEPTTSDTEPAEPVASPAATVAPPIPEASSSETVETEATEAEPSETSDDDNDPPPGPPSGGVSSESPTTGDAAAPSPTEAKPSPKKPKSKKAGGKRGNKNKSGGGQGFGFIAPQNLLDSTPSGQKSFRMGWVMAILLLLGLGGSQISRVWESRPRQLAAIESFNSPTAGGGTSKDALLKQLQLSPVAFATYAQAWGIASDKSEFSAEEAAKITSTATAIQSGKHPTWQAYLDATTEERAIASSPQTEPVKGRLLPQRYDRLPRQVSQTAIGIATAMGENLDRNLVEPLFATPEAKTLPQSAMASQGYGDCPQNTPSTATTPAPEETPLKYLQAEVRSR